MTSHTHRQTHEGTTQPQASTGAVVLNFIKSLANRRHEARTRLSYYNISGFPKTENQTRRPS